MNGAQSFTGRHVRAAILTLAGLVAGCAPGTGILVADGDVCNLVNETLLRGQRSSFGLQFQAA